MEGDASTESDRTGRFLLLLKTAATGRRVLQIHGKTASRPDRQYGFYEYGFTVAAGRTCRLAIWCRSSRGMPVIPSLTTREVVITTPHSPDWAHLPAKTTLCGEDGKPVTAGA
jgi:hypothetical protein